MTDEQDTNYTAPDAAPDDAPDAPSDTAPDAPPAAEEPEEEHPVKEGARGAVAKVVGVAVELGSILGGEGGDIVGAQREVAEAETEELIDRIDGEG